MESSVRMDEQLLPAQLHGNEQGHTGLFEQFLQTDLLLLFSNCTVPASSREIFSSVVISQSMQSSS